MRRKRSRVVLVCLVVVGSLALLPACGNFSVTPAREIFEEASVAPARLSFADEIPVAQVSGTPEQMGAELGALAGKPAKDLLSSWKFADFFRSIVEPSVASTEDLLKVVPQPYLQEIDALSRMAGIDSSDLLRANAVVDACACTAFVASGDATGGAPLLIGRNLDFAPANVLGKNTLLVVYHPENAHAFVSIGWPGFAAVASGMNDQGLCAFILINSAAQPRGAGIPLGFCLRRILERCSNVEEARALFHADPPASGHFLFLADARTAACVSRDTQDRLLEDGLLSCTNGRVDPETNAQDDQRARCVKALLQETKGSIDVETARSILAATRLRLENTHAMVLEPETRVLWLARGTTFAPAALGHWDRLDLADALAGRSEVKATAAGPVNNCFRHWKDKEYR
jgi:hypothetical protein